MFRFNFIFILILYISLQSCQSDASQVRTCFNDFKSAVLERNGKKAAGITDKGTINFFTQVMEDVRTLDSTQLQTEKASLKFLILKIRHMIPREQITAMNGYELIVALVNRGISSNGGIREHSLGEITLKGDTARAQRIDSNSKTPFTYSFVKEESTWKIMKLGSGYGSALITELASAEEMTENDYIFKVLENISGRKPSNEIWQPVK